MSSLALLPLRGSGEILCMGVSYMLQPSFARMLVPFVSVWGSGKCVCIWTVLVLGPSPLSRCGGGEREHY